MTTSKGDLRRQALAKRRSLNREQRERKSQQIVRRILSHYRFWCHSDIAIYVAQGSEVDLSALVVIARKRRLCLWVPVITDSKARKMVFCPLNALSTRKSRILFRGRVRRYWGITLMFCPLVAFDDSGNRIGMGQGYYDRYLVRTTGVLKVGVAFECQRLVSIPCDPLDVPLQLVVTEDEVVDCSGL